MADDPFNPHPVRNGLIVAILWTVFFRLRRSER
ncbi:hypothetical protein FHX82_000773 [Amycolatopsis bartoniae]|nr:hypothetical protein [Amycolatopsis bartoniae]